MLFEKAFIDYNSVLVFVHVPKSGGSTVRENLSKYFKKDQILKIQEPSINHYYSKEINSDFRYENKNPISRWLKTFPIIKKILKSRNSLNDLFNNGEYLKNFYSLTADELQKIRFISCLQERFNIPPILGKNFLKITIIRNPVDRIQSYYFYARQKKNLGSKPYIKAANKYDINDFIHYLYDNRPYMVKNPYSVCISGTEDFSIAKKVIDAEFFLAAPIEKMNEFSEILTLKLFSKKLVFDKVNIGLKNKKKIIISDKLVELINSTNQADINLKNHIEKEFDIIFKKFIS